MQIATPTPPVQQPLATSEPWLLLGISRGSWNRLRAAGKTPPPIFLIPGRPTWRLSDLEKWINSKPAREKPTNRGGRRERAEDDEQDDATN